MSKEAKIYHVLVSPDEVPSILGKYINLGPSGTEVVDVSEALGRVLAEDVVALSDVPPFDRSEVDGYAVIADDTFGADEDNPVKLQVVGKVRIGEIPAVEVVRGKCVEVDTGAIIPRGADAVVMIEYTKRINSNEVLIYRSVSPGENIAFVGTDIVKGELLLREGTLITPREVAVLAASGVGKVKVYRKIKIGIVSIGNELVSPGTALNFGSVYDVNTYSIASTLSELGAIIKSYGIVRDNEEELRGVLNEALRENDIVITSGGTSAGVSDLAYRVVDTLGKPGIIIHGLKMKPGKPTFFAVIGNKLVVGLPGFPLSAAAALHYVVKPLVLKMMGLKYYELPHVEAELTTKIVGSKGKLTLIPTILTKRNNTLRAIPIFIPSGSIRIMSIADGFLVIPEKAEVLEAGTQVRVILFSGTTRIPELLIMGSHDYILDRIISVIGGYGFIKSINIGSLSGIIAVAEGKADIAGTHLLDPESLDYNIPYIKRLGLENKVIVVRGYIREIGLIIAKDNPKNIRGISDLLRHDVVIVNRIKGSGTRVLLDLELRKLAGELNVDFNELIKRIRGYNYEVGTHTAVAAAVKQGRADVGLGIRYAAELYGLDFIKLGEEIFDFVINRSSMDNEHVKKFIQYLRSTEFRKLINSFKGYYLHQDTGKIILP